MPRAVCLLSGGLDSATTLALAGRDGFSCYALSFDYGQRHRVELECAARVAHRADVAEHRVMKLDPGAFAGSALTGGADVPKHDRAEEIGEGIPVTYVPARNTVFLSFALGWAEVLGARDIYIGVNAVDYSGYPDCRPEFISAFERMADLATRAAMEGAPLRVHAPLISLTKADIVKLGMSLGVDYSLTTSCYDPDGSGRACGRCDSCLLRLKGFAEAGFRDPIEYRPR
ncbi:MAG: 7-cyano-7-deazaguanine synthase QueC [Bryobacteraceae bacterium]|nr:7-cyano-7-deazaguanine synthase QueC [Bryobacteraceae bacterium]